MNFTFINPLFLWGLPLVGLPVLIHLLTKKKARRMAFSDVKFIQLASFKAVRRHKLKEFLLLLLRMLIVLLVVLFFARPVFYALPILSSGDQTSASVVFILDNSYSMGYQTGEKSSFSLGKDILKNLVDKLDKKDRAAFILMNTGAESPVAALIPDKKVLSDEIDKSGLTFQATDISASIAKAYAILGESVSPNKQIVVLTDLAANGYKNINESGLSKDIFKGFDPQVKFIFVDLGNKHHDNSAVVKVATEPGIIDQPVKIRATVANYSAGKIQNLETSLYLDETAHPSDRKKAGEGFISLNAAGRQDKDFFYTFTRRGVYTGTIQIRPDNLTADDRFYFKLPVEDKVKVLLVDGKPDISFYNSATYYLKLALNPATEGSPVVSFVSTVREFETKNPDDFAVIALVNVQGLKAGIKDKLYQFITRGGGLIIFVGDNVNPEEYNAELGRFLPVRLVKIEGVRNKNDNFYRTIAPPEVNNTQKVHPILQPFSGQDAGELDKARFYKYFSVEPKPGSEVLLKFTNGEPYLVEGGPGGRVLFFASGANRDWNNLPAKPAYVALTQQAVRYLGKKEEMLRDEDIYVGGKIEKTFPPVKLPRSVQVISPEKKIFSFKPLQDKDVYKITFDRLDTPGIYRLRYEWGDKNETEYIAVNLDLANGESDLTKIDKGQLKKLFPESPLVIVNDLKNLDAEFLRLLKGKELSKSLLFLLAGLVLAEGFLGNFKLKN
ncbi:MAG: BatA domain-containing protein [bacterium]